MSGKDKLITRKALVINKRYLTDDDPKCPVCGKDYVDVSLIDECSLNPGDLNSKHCFSGATPGKLLLIEHNGSETQEEQINENEAVEIDVN